MHIGTKICLVVVAGAVTGGVAWAAAPAIAACLGGLGVLGTASTGASILALEGAALTSASLASLGGGALAVGGGGIAAGVATIATTGAVVGGVSTGAIMTAA
jgi:hypothetical protein